MTKILTAIVFFGWMTWFSSPIFAADILTIETLPAQEITQGQPFIVVIEARWQNPLYRIALPDFAAAITQMTLRQFEQTQKNTVAEQLQTVILHLEVDTSGVYLLPEIPFRLIDEQDHTVATAMSDALWLPVPSQDAFATAPLKPNKKPYVIYPWQSIILLISGLIVVVIIGIVIYRQHKKRRLQQTPQYQWQQAAIKIQQSLQTQQPPLEHCLYDLSTSIRAFIQAILQVPITQLTFAELTAHIQTDSSLQQHQQIQTLMKLLATLEEYKYRPSNLDFAQVNQWLQEAWQTICGVQTKPSKEQY